MLPWRQWKEACERRCFQLVLEADYWRFVRNVALSPSSFVCFNMSVKSECPFCFFSFLWASNKAHRLHYHINHNVCHQVLRYLKTLLSFDWGFCANQTTIIAHAVRMKTAEQVVHEREQFVLNSMNRWWATVCRSTRSEVTRFNVLDKVNLTFNWTANTLDFAVTNYLDSFSLFWLFTQAYWIWNKNNYYNYFGKSVDPAL